MDTEQLYEIAAKELEVNAPRTGLFAQAFSEALGEEAKTRALYIKLRVDQLKRALSSARSKSARRREPEPNAPAPIGKRGTLVRHHRRLPERLKETGCACRETGAGLVDPRPDGNARKWH
jgi:hypothetical protein